MGLFPEIGRAWLTIDSDIYVRNFMKLNQEFALIIFHSCRYGHMRTHEMLHILTV